MCKVNINEELLDNKEKEYINIQTGEVLDLEKVNLLKDNSALKVNPNIWLYWDFEKNSNVDIFSLSKGLGKKFWWYCSKCDDSYPQALNKKVINRGCSICKGYYTTLKNSFGGKFPELALEWHPTKNGELTPYKVSYGSGIKAWFLCQDCNSDYDTSIDKKTAQNAKCPYCRGLRTNNKNNITVTHPEISNMWNYKKNLNIKPEEFVKGSNQKVFWKCSICKDETHTTIRNKSGCAVCSNKKVLKGFNDMWTINPELASLLLNPEDGYRYMQWSNLKVDWKCFICDCILSNKTISDINKNGFKCPTCTDNISFGERVIYKLLNDLSIDFDYQKTFIWSESRRFDFFIESKSLLLEIQGEQHRNGSFSKIGGRTLEEEIINDKFKRDISFSNNIKLYVELKVDNMNLNNLKKEIKESELMDILEVDEKFIDDFTIPIYDTLILNCWELWNNTDYGVMKISRELKLTKTVIRKYLILGNDLGKCSYSVKDRYKRKNKID